MELAIELGVAVRGLVLAEELVVPSWTLRRAFWDIGVGRWRWRLTAPVWMQRSPFFLLGYIDGDDLMFLKESS
jgi:hypothetical protein